MVDGVKDLVVSIKKKKCFAISNKHTISFNFHFIKTYHLTTHSYIGAWGKREPGWNNLKGLWGKRANNWNKLQSAWGKRDYLPLPPTTYLSDGY